MQIILKILKCFKKQAVIIHAKEVFYPGNLTGENTQE